MAEEYWGLHAIARRLGVHPSTVLVWYERDGLLMLRRRRGLRWVWWTEESLVRTWLVARCRAQRVALLPQRKSRLPGKTNRPRGKRIAELDIPDRKGGN